MSTTDSTGQRQRIVDLLAAASSASNGQRREGNELRPLGRKAARTRNHLLQAASDCFVRNGYRSTSVQDIHQAADVSIGTFYQYFRDKADVMATIVGETILRSSREMFPPLELDDGTPAPRSAVEGFVQYYVSTADFQRVWEEVTHFDEELAQLRWDLSSIIEDSLAEVIARAQRSGTVDPELDPGISARSLAAMVDRHCYLTFVVDNRRDDATVEASIETLTALFRNALSVPPIDHRR